MKKASIIILLAFLLISCRKHISDVCIRPINKEYMEKNLDQYKNIAEVPMLPLTSTTPTVIPVDEQTSPAALQDYIASYRYIPLETSDSALLGRIDKLYSDDSILFIFDKQNQIALRFSTNGTYLGHIGQRGRGPGEFTNPCDMAINKRNKEICILDLQGGKQIFYAYNGALIREQPLFYYYNRLEFIGDNQIASTSYSNNIDCPHIDAHRIVVADSSQTPLYKVFPFPSQLRDDYHWEPNLPLQVCNNRIYYNYIPNDTIWEIGADGYKAAFALDFGHPNPFIKRPGEPLITDTEYETIAGECTHFSGMHLQTNDVACFFITGKDKRIKPLLYNKNSGNILYNINSGTEEDGLKSFFLSGGFNFTWNDTSFVYVMEPFRVMKWMEIMKKHNMPMNLTEQDKSLVDNMTEEDNPVLVIVDLKPF